MCSAVADNQLFSREEDSKLNEFIQRHHGFLSSYICFFLLSVQLKKSKVDVSENCYHYCRSRISLFPSFLRTRRYTTMRRRHLHFMGFSTVLLWVCCWWADWYWGGQHSKRGTFLWFVLLIQLGFAYVIRLVCVWIRFNSQGSLVLLDKNLWYMFWKLSKMIHRTETAMNWVTCYTILLFWF